MSRVRIATGQEARPVWRIHGLHSVSEMQIYPREDTGHQMPAVRDRRTAGENGKKRTQARLLRVQQISRMRFHDAAPADPRGMPEMRRGIHRGEARQAGRGENLYQRGLRLGSGS